ncbi:MAG TPA: hypothetical protein DDW42_04040 [Desulfobacteraceae bacterium]|nr:hypothetical protein [Desulfobacteraceae bacterium]
MFIFLYHFIWTIVLAVCMPIIPLLRNERFVNRLGMNLPSDLLDDCNIWIHALSVGEVISAVPLVKVLNLKYPDRDIVFTVTTSKGMDIAKAELKGRVKALITMPVDFWWSIRRIVNYIRPSFFVLVETDIWPGLISYLKGRGVTSILVNGRVSPRTFRSYQRFPVFARMMFNGLEACLMQSDLDRDRLIDIGIDKKKLKVVGNIKFDRELEPMGQDERNRWLDLMGLGSENPIWVAGSTHKGEGLILLEVYKQLIASFPMLRLIIAPRNIEQSNDILSQALAMGLNVLLKSQPSKNKGNWNILIIDTIGELGRIYGLGKVSFVGGSLVPFGGHNLLEPAGFGCPVLFGPHTEDFSLMSELLIEAGGGLLVRNGEDLYKTVGMLLEDDEICGTMGRLAKEFVENNRGALKRVVTHIGACIDRSGGLH